jgi:hypothetical protein
MHRCPTRGKAVLKDAALQTLRAFEHRGGDQQHPPAQPPPGTEPIVAAEPTKGALLLAKPKIPVIREYITHRLTAK